MSFPNPSATAGAACARTALETQIRRDRIVIGVALIGIAAAAWVYMFHMAKMMDAMDMSGGSMAEMGGAMTMPTMRPWSAADFVFMLFMWAEMMVAMMVPSIAPTVLLFAALNRKRREESRPYVPAAAFLFGYLIAWTGFSVLATLAQWGLQTKALISCDMTTTSPLLGGGMLVAAGIFQLTPMKGACLSHCRSPLGFFTTYWREGVWGAILMGIRNGTFCVACCWLLMLLLFVAGVMNLLWVAAIAAFVLIERLVPQSLGRILNKTAAVLLLAMGLWPIVRTITGG